MSSNIYVEKSGTYPTDAMMVTEKGDDFVLGCQLGGGWQRRIPRAEFDRLFRPYDETIDTAEWYEACFGIEDYFGEDGIRGFTRGFLWNSWETPVFPKESVDQIAAVFDDVVYLAETDEVRVNTYYDDVPHLHFKGFDIVVNGETHRVYQVGDSWCWHRATDD
jgi:hypothetical protein